MNKFAFIIITYDRPDALKRCFDSINSNIFNDKKADLIVSIDNSGKDDALNVAKTFKWEHGNLYIKTFPENLGLRKHVLTCMKYAEKYDAIFLIEDDIILSSSAFMYGTQAVEYYDSNESVAGISLYLFNKNWLRWGLDFEPFQTGYDTFFMRIAQSWGEVITRKQWLKFKEWYEQNSVFVKDNNNVPAMNCWGDSSWLKYFTRYCILNDKYFVYPYVSLSTNCNGFGKHNRYSAQDYQTNLMNLKEAYNFAPFDKKTKTLIRYDEYMNPLFLEDILGTDSSNTSLDLWCTKRKEDLKDYVITLGYYGKKYIKRCSLSLHPVELSLQKALDGDGIYVYKTSDIKNKKPKLYNLYKYSLRISDWRKIKFFSSKLIRETLSKKIFKK